MVGLEEATRCEGARALKSGAERLRSRWMSATRSGERFREGHLREEFDDELGWQYFDVCASTGPSLKNP